ncbi:MAG: tetratricopeptide repeat protein [Bacteroidota bacterium]
MDRAKEVHPVDPELGGYIEDLGWLSSCWPFDWEDHYDQLMEEHPRDIAALTQVFEHAWYVLSYDKAQTLGALLLAQNPIPAVISIVGQMALEDGDPEAAMPLLQRALNLSSSEEEARDIYFGLGVAQQELGRLSHARDHYRRALEADPDFGRALLAIGDLYVTTVSQCGSLEPEDKAVYWLAADYYERAKARDSAGDSLVDNAANARLSNIRSYFPIEEEKHAAGWPEGAAYRVDAGCYRWISEATRVR